jgi:hypothetical protein
MWHLFISMTVGAHVTGLVARHGVPHVTGVFADLGPLLGRRRGESSQPGWALLLPEGKKEYKHHMIIHGDTPRHTCFVGYQ